MGNNWKEDIKYSHYDIEKEKRMLLWVIMRAIGDAGINNEFISDFLSKEEKRLNECIATKEKSECTSTK